MTELASHYARCEGASSTFMGTRTLASECVDCLRRTSDRTVTGLWFIYPPTQFPCQQRLTQPDFEVYE